MKRAVKARRQRNRELAEMDARNRCPICKTAITATAYQRETRSLGDSFAVRYCSWECLDTAVEREAEARR